MWQKERSMTSWKGQTGKGGSAPVTLRRLGGKPIDPLLTDGHREWNENGHSW